MSKIRTVVRTATKAVDAANKVLKSDEFDKFVMNTEDFAAKREGGAGSSITEIAQAVSTLGNASQIINQSRTRRTESGEDINIISPVVMPKGHRKWFWLIVTLGLVALAIAGTTALNLVLPGIGGILFGLPFWILIISYVAFNLWRNSYVEIPDGCQALITRFGKVIKTVSAGRHYLINPWERVGYIVNTTKEYPYNAPIREAPTQGQVNASVDLFLQFRINDSREFIFRLGGVNGFSEKLQNAISEQTRALIYATRAEDIYDLIGESTNVLLESLNEQFAPSVEFVSANITHAEPSSQEYRMDLAAAEMIRASKEAYNYKYELSLRKKKDEGDLDQELASLKATRSNIRADIATYEAQINTAQERALNQANAYAQQLMIEAESEAEANVALYQAQALDIRSLQSAAYPEILEYRYKQQILEHIKNSADKIPQIVNIGEESHKIDYVAIAKEMLGIQDRDLYSEDELVAFRKRASSIEKRIAQRQPLIDEVAAQEAILANLEAEEHGS